ncbi:hypothetical protein M427DRAFT_497297 [Gonapodya prolifera JEL478]|uniref:L domain-like protein n=1 Tax=Gonapodya prolifera (strain JEL478) TaxID=1344416 RepID=A0A139AF76_GONPJ|nr:hypothetical protein M427DRAFT_497297 [Gonapodya prolifera JEL478]|eukprot:KXS15410.1 hypothetical protein M427DRAFT_497297 [Gonapodya prolifera JEL478]
MQENAFTGSIPSLVGFPKLQILNLGNNRLSGEIPLLSVATNLSELYLPNNPLSGPIPNLRSTSNLASVDLSGNQLNRSIDNLLPSGSNLKTCKITYTNTNPDNIFTTASTPPQFPKVTPDASNKGAPIAPIVGGVVGGVAAVALFVIGVVLYRHRKPAESRVRFPSSLLKFSQANQHSRADVQPPPTSERERIIDADSHSHWYFARVAGAQGLEHSDQAPHPVGDPFMAIAKVSAHSLQTPSAFH